MKNKLIIILAGVALIVFLAVRCIPDNPHPMNCYWVHLTVNTIDGEIIQTKSEYIFVFDAAELEKWQADEGVKISHDSITHWTVIEIRQCVEPEKKGEQQ